MCDDTIYDLCRIYDTRIAITARHDRHDKHDLDTDTTRSTYDDGPTINASQPINRFAEKDREIRKPMTEVM